MCSNRVRTYEENVLLSLSKKDNFVFRLIFSQKPVDKAWPEAYPVKRALNRYCCANIMYLGQISTWQVDATFW